MTILSRLSEVTNSAHNNSELPREIVIEVRNLAAQPDIIAGKEGKIMALIHAIEEYDPYAGVGCFGGGSSLDDVRRALLALKE